MAAPNAINHLCPCQQCSLRRLRDRYQQGRDLWSVREWAHLCFLRWLVQSGRLAP